MAMQSLPAKNTFGKYSDAIAQWATVIGRPAPAPLVADKLNPEFVEWMQGLPAGHVTAQPISRAKQLHVLGNGVVPLQAAHAFGQLFARHLA
jgi:DNA (cytosine-5)-methyltransferase 1